MPGRIVGGQALRRWLLVALACLAATPRLAAAPEQRHVLILSSYHMGYHWSEEIIRGIHRALDAFPGALEFSYEWLDTKRYAETPAYYGRFARLFEHKYRLRRPDLLLLSDNSALDFLAGPGRTVFAGVPTVFCGINDYTPATRKLVPRSTGVAEQKRMNETVALFLRLHPGTRRVAIISDDTGTGRIDAALIRAALVRYPELGIEELSGARLSLAALLERLRTLPPDTVVFFASFWRDADDTHYAADKILPRLTGASSAPFYTHADTFVIGGIVGGVVVHGFTQGSLAGRMAARILQGEEPETIEVELHANLPLFDHAALVAHGIDQALLPAGSLVINRPPPGFYERHTTLIWAVILVFITMLFFIIGLANSILRRRRAERALSESMQRMELALAGGDLGIWDRMIAEERVVLDRRSAAMLGHAEENLAISHPLWESMIHHEDAGNVRAALAAHLAGRADRFETEFRLRRRDGSWLWVLARAKVIERDGHGAPARLSGTLLDLTARKEIEEALHDKSLELEQYFTSALDLLCIADTSGCFVRVNKAWENTLGYSVAELENRRFLDFVHPDDMQATLAAIQRLDDQETILNFTNRYRCRDGSYRSIEWRSLPRGRLIYAAARDITERIRMEEALRKSEENLRVTLNSIGDAVIATDTGGRVVRMNPVAERLTGWNESEATGKALDEVFRIFNYHTGKAVKSPVDEVIASGHTVGLANHTVLHARDGREYQIADSGAPIRDDTGAIVGVVLVFRDVTEEYALQEQLRQSQKMEAIGRLAGGIAHDFNNMLGGILGATEILKPQVPPTVETDQMFSIICDSTRRAADLAGKLLAFARRQAAGSTPVDIHDCILHTVALLERTVDKRIRIETWLEADAATVIGDPSQIQSVFLNLGINAAHAMPEGGTLSIHTKRTEVSSAHCETSPFPLEAGAHINIEFRDTGTGILPENMERIFEPFFTTKEPGRGTGLGLSAGYGIVQQHKGAITVYSEPGRGSSFHILLPLTDQPFATNTPPETPVHGKGVILLVDDEAVMRTIGSALLEQYGYRVLLAENGEVALEIFREKHDTIDLVVLDMIMPRMNGRDCFREMRRINPDARIILSSGFSHEEDLGELRENGLAGFVHKPYSGAELSRVVAAALDGGRAGM